MKPGPRKGNRKQNREADLKKLHSLLKEPLDAFDLAVEMNYDPRTIRYKLRPEIEAGRIRIIPAETSNKGHWNRYLYKSEGL